MAEKKSFYITTTLPYVNAEPHIGFAMEIIHADIVARWKKLQGYEVFFNTGTDEHGQKVYKAALAEGKDPQKYTDELAEKFKGLKTLLGLLDNLHFIRTTEERHKKAAQEMWKRCEAAGDIYKKDYTIKYCVGCELEKTDSEIENGHCLIHPNLELEIRQEENYFFRFSKYAPKLLELYKKNTDLVIPDFRLNEIKALIERGLEDFSISRLKEKMPWGVEVPGDSKHVMYVWFDALVSYISTLGWPEDKENFEEFWVNGTPTQYAGKDQVRQQAAMWQAMLVSANLPNTHQIAIHGFINYEGQKMSKSLGNVISPQEIVDKFGSEALRYFVAREFNQFEDTDISMEKLRESFNSNLANGLGNLTSRVVTLCEKYDVRALESDFEAAKKHPEVDHFLEKYEIKKAMDWIWSLVKRVDVGISTIITMKLLENNTDDAKRELKTYLNNLIEISSKLLPFMPETSRKIEDIIRIGKKPSHLFERIDA